MRWFVGSVAAFAACCVLSFAGHPVLAGLVVVTAAVAVSWQSKRSPLDRPRLPFGAVTERVRAEVYDRDGMTCRYCRRAVHPACGLGHGPLSLCDLCASLDHVLPRSRGGTDQPDDLVTACWRCNDDKAARTPEEWADAGTWFAEAGSWPAG